MPRGLSRVFALSSLLFLIVLAISPTKNYFRSYRSLQGRFRRLGMERARSLKAAEEYGGRPVAIRQIWLRDLDDRVDRCTTCHLGAADALMQGAPAPFGLHPEVAHAPADFDRFGCTVCHGGQGPATSESEAHGSVRGAGPPMIPAGDLESACGRCHAGAAVPEAPALSHGRALMLRYNCFACHAARGHESFASDAPRLETLPVKTGALWLKRWLADPKSLDPNTTMPNFQLGEADIGALSHYLFSQTPPADLARRVEAAEAEPPGDPAAGKKIFSESRCISCHTVEGKGNGSAPELSKVASAATRGWLLSFLRDPHAFNPRSRMPQYHFTDAESRDVVAYLEDEMRDFDAPKDQLDPLRVNQTLAETGKRLFRQFGCFACHTTPGGAGGEKFGPDLDGIGDKRAASLDFGRRADLPRSLPAWLEAKITAPRSFAAGLKMPTFGFDAEDTQAIVIALLSLGAQPVPPADQVATAAKPSPVPAGPIGRIVDRYRCLSCHSIGDRGGDISTAPLTFEGSKVKREWLVDYLVLSYSIRPILEERMPVFRMPREEAALLADAFASFYLDPAIPEDPFAGRPPEEADPGAGQRLYATLGCRACHIIGTAGGYYGPPLTETAKRLRPGWVYSWLKGPQRWRADVRCPDYGLDDGDALRLTAYLETLSGAAAAPPAGVRP